MVRITWLGHSSFQLQLETGEVYLIDPWIEGNPSFPVQHEFTRVDAILVSHGHGDHLGGVEALAKKFGATVVCNYEIYLYLKSLGVAAFAPMNKGGRQTVGPLGVTMTQALHSSGIEDGKGNVIYGGEAAGFILHLPDGRRAYFAGDTGVFGDMALIAELYSPGLCFLPIGDVFTMGPAEAAVATRLLKAKTVIPMHYGTFPLLSGTPADFAARVAPLGAKVWTLAVDTPVSY